ncbi:MAG: hypothetical protein JRJ50_05740 [Deltaproteobacteria bacterium]|nr:hypothetical protein [Deltaproteobacteria bacterium]MBW2114444.1 hypothetical protein [Deltaproteobacteria bacterium]
MKKHDSQKSQTMKNVFLNRQMILPGKIMALICMAVIPLLIFCPSSWALDKSSLNGTFISGEFESGFLGGDPGNWGANDEVILYRTETTFDGVGHFTMTTYEYKFVRNIGESGTTPSNKFETTYTEESGVTDSGAYTVSPDGEVTMNFVGGDGDTGTGYLSEDGRTLVFGWSEFEGVNQYCAMGIGVGIKRGSGFIEDSLDGTYVFSEFETGFHGGSGDYWGANDEQYWIRTEIAFDGDGGFILTGHEYKINREIGESGTTLSNKFETTAEDSGVTDSGTYTITDDGVVTLNFEEEPTSSVTGYVGEGGQTMVFGWVEFEGGNQYCAMGLGMGVKRGSGFTTASVKGTYVVGLFESDFYGPDPNGGWGATDDQELDKEKFTFDGAGNFKVVSDEYEMERIIGEVTSGGGYSNEFTTTYTEELNESGTGTYTVSNEGVLTLSFVGGDIGIAYLSADGKTLVTGWSEYSNVPGDYYGSTGIGFGVKVPKVNKALPAIYLLLLGD